MRRFPGLGMRGGKLVRSRGLRLGEARNARV